MLEEYEIPVRTDFVAVKHLLCNGWLAAGESILFTEDSDGFVLFNASGVGPMQLYLLTSSGFVEMHEQSRCPSAWESVGMVRYDR